MLVLFSIALVLAGIYFCLPGSVLSSFPFACQIPETPVFSAPSSSPSTAEEATPADPPLPNGSQEVSELTGQGDTLLSLLNANLDDADEARKISASLTSAIRPALDKPFGPHAVLQSGRRYSLTVDAQGRFLRMSIELDPANVFHCVRENGALRSWKEEVVLDYQAETITFALRGSLHESIINSGEGTELALKLLNVFRWDIDFQSESMSGDICKVLFERRYADDRPSGYGDILCAVYDGKKTGRKVAVLFNRAYYDENGVTGDMCASDTTTDTKADMATSTAVSSQRGSGSNRDNASAWSGSRVKRPDHISTSSFLEPIDTSTRRIDR